MTGKVKVGVAIAAPILALLTLGSLLWLNRPFQVELASYRTSLADRTEAQRHNIRQAAKALDGVLIEPGETFSFNQVVGPRTPERGYREAPAYMERDFVTSVGGGLCQVSSTVYNAAALSGLSIIERHPHSRQVASVPPGRDSTVWYGMLDLRFENPYSNPIRISLMLDKESLAVAIRARSATAREITVRTIPLSSPRANRAFKTVRYTKMSGTLDVQEVLSIDTYAN